MLVSGEENGIRKSTRELTTTKKERLKLLIINEAYQQPFSGFFVMVHDDTVKPLYVRGKEASEELAILAEDGNPNPLVDMYKKVDGVYDAFAFTDGAPYVLGDTPAKIKVTVPKGYYVTIAAMAINTNDCFVAINGEMLYPGQILDLPGLDAGSEENNELCTSIPGPACPSNTGNVRSGNGEGYVHVHRGFHGVGNPPHGKPKGTYLSQQGYDWRNPMMRVIVKKSID